MISPPPWEMFCVLLFLVVVCASALDIFLGYQNFPLRLRRRYLKRFVTCWIGIGLGIMYKLWIYEMKADKEFHKNWRLLPNGTFVPSAGFIKYNKRSEDFEGLNKKPVIFITTTEYSVVQAALLTRLGQAMYPVRQNVFWIVVQLPLETCPFHEEIVKYAEEGNVSFGKVISHRKDLVREHLKNVDLLISRFGIPYKLLGSDEPLNTSWAGFNMMDKVDQPNAKGYLSGLLWAVRNLSGGVVLLGDEQYAYNSALFPEVQKTRIASCWPIAFGQGDSGARLSMPVADRIHVAEGVIEYKLLGYDSSKFHESVPVQRSGFAIDLEYLQKRIPYMDYWKLVFDAPYTNNDFSIKLDQIQALGLGGPEIYVWRTFSEEREWPSKMKFEEKLIDETNIMPLLQNVFGPRIKVMNRLIITDNNLTFYADYDMRRDVEDYM